MLPKQWGLFAVLSALCLTANAAEPITTGSLALEMADLHRLADFPNPAYKTLQFSSYDHRSVIPGSPDWFDNSDGFGHEPIPAFESVITEPDQSGNGEYLVCDVKGPGAVVREWTARIDGTIRMYLDGQEKPVFDGPAQEFFSKPYQPYLKTAGLDETILKGVFYQRESAYCPFPFAKHCRIVWRGNLKTTHFYHIEVRLYDKEAKVKTFVPEDLATYAKEFMSTAAILRDPDIQTAPPAGSPLQTIESKLEPGQWIDALELEGPKAIERLTLTLDAQDRDLALRQTVLHIAFDKFPWAQVQAPIGDFFGAAPGVNPYVSLPFTVRSDGSMTCRFVMPFAQHARISFENFGAQPVTVRGEVFAAEYTWNPETSMHFRARWRINHDLTGSGAKPQDMPYLLANGKGVYVGTVTYVLNTNDVPVAFGNWWGEGDEKIFVDDDVRPSFFGTGSEDYYNYAWSSADIFAFPYCGQPRNDGPGNRGFVANYRWHILDPLPFQERISFYMELFPHDTNPGMAYGRISYHYAKPGVIDDHVSITREDVRRQELPEAWTPAVRAGAANSVFFEPEDTVQGTPTASSVEDRLWTHGRCYRWTPAQAGEEITFAVSLPQAANQVHLGLAQDAQSGKISMKIDGQDAALPGENGVLDLYVADRVLARCFDAKPGKLEPGSHTITLRYEGGGPSIGIDFLWFQENK